MGQAPRAIYASEEEPQSDGGWYDDMRDGRSVSAERQYKRKDGSVFWCKLVGKAIDPAHPREGAIWIYDDVTAEHAARASLEASRDALERAVPNRTAELEHTKART